MRTYRISRMTDAIVLVVPFERPSNFDLADHWKRSTMQIEQQRQHFSATLALSPEATQSLTRWSQVTPVDAPSNTTIPEDWLIFNVNFESREQARFVALGFGPRAQLLTPARSTRPDQSRDQRNLQSPDNLACVTLGTYLCRYTWIYWLLYIDQYLQAFHLSEAERSALLHIHHKFVISTEA